MAPNQIGNNPGLSKSAWDKLHKFAAKKNLKYQKELQVEKDKKGA